MLRCGDLQISQTLTLAPHRESASTASEAKLKLLGKLRNHRLPPFRQTGQGNLQGRGVGLRQVPDGGLVVHDLLADVFARGKALSPSSAFRFRSPGSNT